MRKGQTPTAETVEVPESLREEVTLLRGLAILNAENTAYYMGAKSLTSDMSDKSKEERKSLTEANKNVRKNLATWVKEGNVTAFDDGNKAITDARKALNDKTKPTRDKIAPLRRGMKYIQIVAIPDSIKELHDVTSDPKVKEKLVVAPAFQLSSWVATAIESKKKRD
jgi:hypothetical protein